MGELLNLTREVLDRARASRDARFDGKFFIAVTSTKIYCRPVCPARTSKACNVRYYATAAEAAEANLWKETPGATVDTTRAYQVRLRENRSIAVFFYDGPRSRAIPSRGC